MLIIFSSLPVPAKDECWTGTNHVEEMYKNEACEENLFTRAANGLRSGTNHCPFPRVNLVQIWAKWEKLITDQTRKRSKLWKIWLASFEFIASNPRIRLALGKCIEIWNSDWLNKYCRLHFEPVFSLDFFFADIQLHAALLRK